MNQVRSLFPIYLVILFGYLGYSMMIAIFTPMILGQGTSVLPANASMGVRTITLGCILFLYPFAQFISSPILGAFSDRFGRRPLLLLSLFFTTIFYVFIALGIELQSLSLLMVALFLAGLSEGNVTIAQSTITDVAEGPERIRCFGYIYVTASLAYVIGPLFGGKLAGWFSYSIPFWGVALLLLILLLWLFFSFKETHTQEKRILVHYFEALTNLKNIFRIKRLQIYFVVNFFLYLAIFGFFRSYPMYLVDEYHLDVSKLSEFIAWLSVPIIIVNLWITGFLAKRVSPWTVTLISAILMGIFIEGVLIPEGINWLWLTLFLTGFAIALCLPASVGLLSSMAEVDEQGRVMGNNQSLQFFTEAVSGVGAGFLAALFIKLPLLTFGIVSFFGALFLLLFSSPKITRD